MATTAATASTEAEPREYIVLLPIENVSDHGHEMFAIVGRTKALRKEDALDEIVDELPKDEQGGPFIAIAARYWVEMTPEIEPPPPPKRSWK